MVKKANGMTYSEIGSYFWLDEFTIIDDGKDPVWMPDVLDSTFTFSGRASIEIALRDILKSRKIKNVYIPSYCCISMLQPFVDYGLKIQYYDVVFDNGRFQYDIEDNIDCDVILIMNYFGIDEDQTHAVIEKLHYGNAVIIEDITHSLLSEKAYSVQSDYLVASLRKWFAIPTGGWLGKLNGDLVVKPNLSNNHTVDEKIQSMKEKAAYISGEIVNKEHFLLMNAKFENDLIHADRMLTLDDMSYGILGCTDVEFVKRSRKRNANTLIQGLKELAAEEIRLPEFNLKKDTPLFVPIFLKKDDRDSLRKYLIDHGVYCPVHWPEIVGAPVSIRPNELSLVCDQRYLENDMNAVVRYIKEWATANQTMGKNIYV